MSAKGWIGVDLDGTLAEYHGWTDGSVGKPIPKMLERVKRWLAERRDVRIFTARITTRVGVADVCGNVYSQAAIDAQRRLIEEWCLEHLGWLLPITATKDSQMIELWDDRCVAVEPNTGRAFSWRGENAPDVDHVPIQVVDKRRTW